MGSYSSTNYIHIGSKRIKEQKWYETFDTQVMSMAFKKINLNKIYLFVLWSDSMS